MKRVAGIVISLVFILAIAILESIASHTYLTSIYDDAINIANISNNSNFQGEEIVSLVDNIDSSWTEKEKILCLLVNHKDIEDIGEKITNIKTAIETNNYDAFDENLELVIFFAKSYKHLFGISVQNIL